MSEISTEHARRMAELAGFRAFVEGDRLIVAGSENNLSLFIVDGTVSRLGFERGLEWLKETEKR